MAYIFSIQERQIIGDYYLSRIGEAKALNIIREIGNTEAIWLNVPPVEWIFNEIAKHYCKTPDDLVEDSRKWEKVRIKMMFVYIVVKLYHPEYFEARIIKGERFGNLRAGLRQEIAAFLRKDGSLVSHYINQLSKYLSYDKKLIRELNSLEIHLYLKFNGTGENEHRLP